MARAAASAPLKATEAHCAFAFASIEAAFRGEEVPPAPTKAWETQKCPFFVTLNKNDGAGRWDLRGCIGTLSSRPVTDIARFARSSAFEDGRFPPLEENELPELECGISLLVQYEKAKAWDDWVVGTHGILIDFDAGSTSFRATYLPEVAHEQGWDKLTALKSLVRKAGYTGECTDVLLEGIALTRYQSSKCKLSYSAYRAAPDTA